jgi:hypothetical protein
VDVAEEPLVLCAANHIQPLGLLVRVTLGETMFCSANHPEDTSMGDVTSKRDGRMRRSPNTLYFAHTSSTQTACPVRAEGASSALGSIAVHRFVSWHN